MSEPRVDAVIVSFNTRDLTLAAVASVLAARGVETQVWVVDNASSDGSADAVRQAFPQVHVLETGTNVGFGRGNNAGLGEVRAPFVLLLNSDAVFQDPQGLRTLVDALQAEDRVGLVGPRLVAPDGTLEYSARAFPSAVQELVRGAGLHPLLPAPSRERLLAHEFWDHRRRGSADWVTGACILLRREVVDEVGGFDPAIFMYGEEMELCWRARRAGWEVLFEPGVTVVHRRGASGASGGWRVRLAMAGDAYVVRKHRGLAGLGVFFVARCVGLALTVCVQGVLGWVTWNGERRRRARAAVGALGAWLSAVIRGGSSRPDAGWLLPPGRTTSS